MCVAIAVEESMVPASGSHPAVTETLMLVRQQLRSQAEIVELLRSQLVEAERKLALLETLNGSLDQFQPDAAEIPFTLPAATSGALEGSLREAPTNTDLDLRGFRANRPLSIQEMTLNILSTAQRPLRTGDLVTIIERLRNEGHTDLLRGSKRPDSVVTSALDRLRKKGLVTKIERGLYALGGASGTIWAGERTPVGMGAETASTGIPVQPRATAYGG
ncbi:MULTISPECIES: hypothetical protein [unclassified Streptomyces]|uniref:hypothetical protein n=1 Tax=unclassified Streptomyces TaxID=2593676 RepID=UPI003656694B